MQCKQSVTSSWTAMILMLRRLWETGANTVSLQALLAWHSALCLGGCPRLPSANPASLKQTPTLASMNLSLRRHCCFLQLCCIILCSVLLSSLLHTCPISLFCFFVSYFCILLCSVPLFPFLLCQTVPWPLRSCPCACVMVCPLLLWLAVGVLTRAATVNWLSK